MRYDLPTLTTTESHVIAAMRRRRPDLDACLEPLLLVHGALVRCYENGGTVFTCGNGGSHADAVHIVGELCKSFERRRPLPRELQARLAPFPFGAELQQHLEAGLSAVALGLNSALKTAVENDSPLRDVAFAQEANALMKPGDVLLALSTSGQARNCLMAMSVAKARGGVAIALTGPAGGPMAEFADLAIRAPGDSTKVIQEAHIVVWHTMCCLIEAHFFPEMR